MVMLDDITIYFLKNNFYYSFVIISFMAEHEKSLGLGLLVGQMKPSSGELG